MGTSTTHASWPDTARVAAPRSRRARRRGPWRAIRWPFVASLVALALTTLVVATVPVHADSAPVGPTNLVPLFESDVRLARERLVIELDERSARVDATFRFANDGPPKTVTMGFPDVEGLDSFSVTVDGRPVPVATHPGLELPFSWVVRFARGSSHVVRVRYRSTAGGYQPYSPPFTRFFEYVLSTGRRWKGPVGDLDVEVRLAFPPSWLLSYPPGFHLEGNVLRFRAREFEPAHDLVFAFSPLADGTPPEGELLADARLVFREVRTAPVSRSSAPEQDLNLPPLPFTFEGEPGALANGQLLHPARARLERALAGLGVPVRAVQFLDVRGDLLLVGATLESTSDVGLDTALLVANVADAAHPRLLYRARGLDTDATLGSEYFAVVQGDPSPRHVSTYDARGQLIGNFTVASPGGVNFLGSSLGGDLVCFWLEHGTTDRGWARVYTVRGEFVELPEGQLLGFARSQGRVAFALSGEKESVLLILVSARAKGRPEVVTYELSAPGAVTRPDLADSVALAIAKSCVYVGLSSVDNHGVRYGHVFRVDLESGHARTVLNAALPGEFPYLSFPLESVGSALFVNLGDTALAVLDARSDSLIGVLGGLSPSQRLFALRAFEGGRPAIVARTFNNLYFLKGLADGKRATLPPAYAVFLDSPRERDVELLAGLFSVSPQAEPTGRAASRQLLLTFYGSDHAHACRDLLRRLGIDGVSLARLSAPPMKLVASGPIRQGADEQGGEPGEPTAQLVHLLVGFALLGVTVTFVWFLSRSQGTEA